MTEPAITFDSPGKQAARCMVLDDALALAAGKSSLECFMLPSANPIFEFNLIGELAYNHCVCNITACENFETSYAQLAKYHGRIMQVLREDAVSYLAADQMEKPRPAFDLIWLDLCCCPHKTIAEGLGHYMRATPATKIVYVTVCRRLPNGDVIPTDVFIKAVEDPAWWNTRGPTVNTHIFTYGGGEKQKSPMQLLRFVTGSADPALMHGPASLHRMCVPLAEGDWALREAAARITYQRRFKAKQLLVA